MKKKEKYIRDGRGPIPEKESTSKVMRANKAQNTKPEIILRKALWKGGIKGYRLHWEKAPGKPDISFPGKKIAIFVNGCFWHRCPYCQLPLPKSHSTFWKEKFIKNRIRDEKKINDLHENGWTTIVIWECQLRTDLLLCITKIKELLSNNLARISR